MKVKEIETLLGVPASTLFDWNKPDSKKHALAKLLKELTAAEAEKLLHAKDKKVKPVMIVSTVNSSIGDKSKHFSLISLKNIFYKNDVLTPLEKYAVKTIKKEALPGELEEFAAYYKIPEKRVKETLGLC